ncbi:glutamate racemase [Aureivirga marina]|uniref:glutamate racemase n=1 Tax=Aureivirga marina TaxID=1182451 RepID=UPI0018CA56EE|nr:glutamate racemase [Aureivirga marina]
MNKTINPIGIFDSGVGGTTIWRDVNNLLPLENTIYLADNKNAPYGRKSIDEIIERSIINTEFLLQQNVKLIIVACNTATTNVIQVLREKYSIPFIGIEPAIKPVLINTKSKHVGILATESTLKSEMYLNTSSKYNQNIEIHAQAGNGLVQLIEQGKIDSDEMQLLLENYLGKITEFPVDYLVLGCTHYPYLKNKIQEIIGNSIKIIDSGKAVAKQTFNILNQESLLNQNTTEKKYHHFYSNQNIDTLENLLKDISNKNIALKAF